MRVAEHAYDKSFARMFLRFKQANVSISFSAGAGSFGSSALSVGVEPMSNATHKACGGNCSDYALVVMGSYAWERAGSVAVDQEGTEPLDTDAESTDRESTTVAAANNGGSLGSGSSRSSGSSSGSSSMTFSSYGLRTVSLHTTSAHEAAVDAKLPANITSKPHIAFTLGEGGGLTDSSTSTEPTYTAIKITLDTAKAKELQTYRKFGELSEVKRASQAAVMWCLLYVPTELGAFAPVSREWKFLTPTIAEGLGDEWYYVIFDWVREWYYVVIFDWGWACATARLAEAISCYLLSVNCPCVSPSPLPCAHISLYRAGQHLCLLSICGRIGLSPGAPWS
jgi:hypothetical protein